MTYTLFTFPNCPKCGKVKDYLKSKGIKYDELNAGIGEGRVKFRDFYSKNKEQISRDENGTILLPILSHEKGFLQGLDKIINNGF